MRLLMSSPIGTLLVVYDEGGVRSLEFWQQGRHPPAGTRDEPARGDLLGQEIVRQLREYFAGERREFDLPLMLDGTDFQRRVWEALLRIPFGETRSYAEVAHEIGSASASRAVGQANRANRLPLLIPCHRVVAAHGGLGGYMGSWQNGSGTETKRWLLEHEQRF